MVERLRDRVKIQKLTPTANLSGGFTTVNEDVQETWAGVKPMTGKRAIDLGQLLGGQPYEVTMRYREDLTGPNTEIAKNYVLEVDGKKLKIHSVVNQDLKKRYLMVIAYASN